MIELIDIDGNIKFMASIISYIEYGGLLYVLYSIKRDEEEDNIFVSKLVNSSDGYVMDYNFNGGEKEVFDNIVRDIFNKDTIKELESKGIRIVKDIKLSSINKFSVTRCYVSTFKRNIIKECMNNYNLVSDKKNIIVKEKKVSYFSKSNMSTIISIIFGIVIIILAVIVIFNYFK